MWLRVTRKHLEIDIAEPFTPACINSIKATKQKKFSIYLDVPFVLCVILCAVSVASLHARLYKLKVVISDR